MPKKDRAKMPAYKKDESRERSRPYTASSGLKVILTGLPPLAPQRIDASIEYPSKPTYEVTTASGDVESYEHDKESLAAEGTTDEEKQAWADYLEAYSDAETELTEKLLYAVLLDCVELQDFESEFAHWKINQRLMGISIAEGEEDDEESLEEANRENIFYFMQTQVFHDSDDIGEILTSVMSLTGVSVEDLAEARDSFPGEMESESSTGNGDTAGQSEDPSE